MSPLSRRAFFFGTSALVGALALLAGETSGFAVDFTGKESAKRVIVRTAGADVYSEVDAFFSNGGTSPKQVYDNTGTLVWSPHNYALQSQTFDNASWTKTRSTISANATTAPDGTATADKLVEDSSAATSHFALQAIAGVVGGSTITVSVRVKAAERSWICILDLDGSNNSVAAWFNVSAGTVGTRQVSNVAATITSLGDGWYLCSSTYVSVSTTPDITLALANVDNSIDYSGNGASGVYLWGAQPNRGTVPTAYLATTTAARFGLALDYNPSTLAARGLLVEPAATNLMLQSNNIGTTWANVGSTETINATTAPNGLVEADKLIESVGGADHNVIQAITTTVAAYTFSVYLKAAERSFAALVNETTNQVRVFDLSNGTLGGVAGASPPTSSTIESVGNGWYRASIVHTATAAANTFRIHTLTSSNPANTTYAGDGASGIYVWGAQLELGSIATSPIPTFAATVTRAGDLPFVATSAIPFSATAGTMVIELQVLRSAQYPRVFEFNDTTINENIFIYQDGATNFGMNVDDGGVNQVSAAFSGAVTLNTTHKVAVAWALNDFAGTLNAGTVATDAAGTLPTITRLNIGHNAVNAQIFHGHYRKLTYLPRRATNTELQTKTT